MNQQEVDAAEAANAASREMYGRSPAVDALSGVFAKDRPATDFRDAVIAGLRERGWAKPREQDPSGDFITACLVWGTDPFPMVWLTKDCTAFGYEAADDQESGSAHFGDNTDAARAIAAIDRLRWVIGLEPKGVRCSRRVGFFQCDAEAEAGTLLCAEHLDEMLAPPKGVAPIPAPPWVKIEGGQPTHCGDPDCKLCSATHPAGCGCLACVTNRADLLDERIGRLGRENATVAAFVATYMSGAFSLQGMQAGLIEALVEQNKRIENCFFDTIVRQPLVLFGVDLARDSIPPLRPSDIIHQALDRISDNPFERISDADRAAAQDQVRKWFMEGRRTIGADPDGPLVALPAKPAPKEEPPYVPTKWIGGG